MSQSVTEDMGEEEFEQIEHAMEHLLDSFNPFKNKLNWLLLALPVAIWANFSHNQTMAFAFSMLAIMPLAFLMGKGTEEIALRTGEAIGGLLNATFGNAVELIIAGLAIYAASKDPEILQTMVTVTQASLIGSILGNLLLVLGLAILWGGIKHKTQSFNNEASQMNGSLLLLAVVAFIIPSAVHHSGGSDVDIEVLEDACTHIVPVMVRDAKLCKKMSDMLLEDYNIYIQPINFPTVAVGQERLRIAPTPLHTDAMMHDLVDSLRKVFKRCLQQT